MNYKDEIEKLQNLLNEINIYHVDNQNHLKDRSLNHIIDQNLRIIEALKIFEQSITELKQELATIEEKNQQNIRILIEDLYNSHKLDFNSDPKNLAFPSAWDL